MDGLFVTEKGGFCLNLVSLVSIIWLACVQKRKQSFVLISVVLISVVLIINGSLTLVFFFFFCCCFFFFFFFFLFFNMSQITLKDMEMPVNQHPVK